MAVVFITGTPGAGKSYYAVVRLLEDLKNPSNLVITNIDGLDKHKVSLFLDKEVNNLWYLDEFLSVVYQLGGLHYDGNYRNAFLTLLNVDLWKRVILPYFYKELGFKKFIFYLDEFQSIIDEDTDLHQSQKFFFDYHRHLGIDIYLITQSIQRMNKAIRNIAEVELRLVNLRMFGLSSMAVLKTLIGGVVVKKKIIKYDPRIFALYKSALVEHLKGVRGRPPVMLFVALLLLLFSLFRGFSYFSKTGGSLIPKSSISQSSSSQMDNKDKNMENEQRTFSVPSSSFVPYSPPPPPPSLSPPPPPPSSFYTPPSTPTSPTGSYIIIYTSPSSLSPSSGTIDILPSGPTVREIPP